MSFPFHLPNDCQAIEGKGRDFGGYIDVGDYQWFVRELGESADTAVDSGHRRLKAIFVECVHGTKSLQVVRCTHGELLNIPWLALKQRDSGNHIMQASSHCTGRN